MPTKREAQRQARKLRKKWPNRTVNVVEVSSRNWGVRFSPKGKRDTFDYRPRGHRGRTSKTQRRLTIRIGKHHFTEHSAHRTKARARRVAEIQRNKGWLARIRKTASGHTVYVGAFSARRRFQRLIRRA